MQPITLGNLKLNPQTGRYESGYPPVTGWIAGQPPVLQNATAFSDGSNMTITGSNFSMHRQTQLVYDDFSNGSIGQAISAISGSPWETVAGQKPYIIDADGLGAGKRSAFCHMDGGTNGTDYDYMTGIKFAQSFDTIYLESWIKYIYDVTTGGVDSPQLKMFRVGPGSDDNIINLLDHSDNPNLALNDYTTGAPQTFQSPDDDGTMGGSYISLPADNTWRKVHMAGKISTMGQPDGWRYFKTSTAGTGGDCSVGSWANGTQKHFASPNSIVARTAWAGEPWITRMAPDSSTQLVNWRYQRVLLPYFTRSYQRTRVRVAGFWMNDTAERVVISNSNDWNTALKTGIIQPSVSKTNTSWVVKNELGNLPSTGPLYAYLVNADGIFNTVGYQVRG